MSFYTARVTTGNALSEQIFPVFPRKLTYRRETAAQFERYCRDVAGAGCQLTARARTNSRGLRPIRRAPMGRRHTAAVVAQLSVTAPINTIAAFATANNATSSKMYCSQAR